MMGVIIIVVLVQCGWLKRVMLGSVALFGCILHEGGSQKTIGASMPKVIRLLLVMAGYKKPIRRSMENE